MSCNSICSHDYNHWLQEGKEMFEDIILDISDFWQTFDWFGLASYQVIMSALDLILIILGNNLLMSLIIFYLASRWNRERQILTTSISSALNNGIRHRVNMQRRIL